jgi:segregation and condensation protein B
MHDWLRPGWRVSQNANPRACGGVEWTRAWLRRRGADAACGDIDVLDLETRSPKLARLEAALLVADGPLTPRKLSQFATLADAREARELVDQLNASYDRTRSAFRIERVASGYQLLTRSRFAAWLDRLHNRQARLKLSSPLQETLAIVAYRQPATRADIEAVRGVQSAEILKQLMERGLVKIVGEDDSLGRPYLYGTTRSFLEQFGLTSLDELPMAETLRRPASELRAPPEEEEAATESDVQEATAADAA